MKEPFVPSEQANQRPPIKHPRTLLVQLSIGGLGHPLVLTRCGACGETAYGSRDDKSVKALAESSCLPVELAWNNRIYGYPK